MNVAEWAEAYRYLGRAVSPEAGKFRCDRLPYQREPMEAFTDEAVGETILMWGAQMGKTELLLNAVGYFIHMNPSPMLAVYPTLDTARKWSTKKLAMMLRETPVLRGTVKDPRSRDSGNTVLSKDYSGGFLVIAGSNSAASLRQISCRVVLQDEVDSYEASAGTEGDPCLLADARASNFHDATLIKASTPTIKGASRIEKYFEDSDQRYWFCPCPHCETFHRLEWSQVSWPEAKTSEAVYVCKHCQKDIEDADRIKMILRGEWRATYPNRRVRGYHLSGLYRIMGKKRQFKTYLHEFAENFLTAKDSGKQMLKVWVNTFLAETWEDEGDKVEAEPLLARCELYGGDMLPEGVMVLTAAVDVQGDRLEVEVLGHGADGETWGIEYKVLAGSPEQRGVWDNLDKYIQRTWNHPLGSVLKIAATCIDSGFATSRVYEFCKTRAANRVFPVKGSPVRGAPPIHKRSVKNQRVLLWTLGTGAIKDTLFARLQIEEVGAGFQHFPNGYGYDEEYFKQLTAEEVRTKFQNGFAIRYYRKIRPRNEALDIRVYNMAALEILNPNFEAIAKLMAKDDEDDSPKVKPDRRKGGYINEWR
jgi:phage terminase large subunit GpA-like protein